MQLSRVGLRTVKGIHDRGVHLLVADLALLRLAELLLEDADFLIEQCFGLLPVRFPLLDLARSKIGGSAMLVHIS